jgi:hypothetical protein
MDGEVRLAAALSQRWLRETPRAIPTKADLVGDDLTRVAESGAQDRAPRLMAKPLPLNSFRQQSA